MSEGKVALAAIHGTENKPLSKVLQSLLDASPSLAWCEPVPTRSRLPGFQGLWSAFDGLRPLLSDGVALEEARLFWPKGSVHLLATGEQTRWAAFWEPHDSLRPDWLAALVAEEQQGKPIDSLHVTAEDVLTQRDWRRYGLEPRGTAFPKKLKLTRYQRGTGLVFWQLREEVSREG